MIVEVTRIESFSVAHRLNSVQLSQEENLRLYGKCNNLNGHGHNYKLEVSAAGPVDLKTGMVCNLTDLKLMIKERILDVFDHTNLDLDHPNHFAMKPSTTENFLLVIAEELKDEFKRLPASVQLKRIILWETEKNKFQISF